MAEDDEYPYNENNGSVSRGGSDAVWAMTPEQVLASLVPGGGGGGGGGGGAPGSHTTQGAMAGVLRAAAQLKSKQKALKQRRQAVGTDG
jgi:hypothetical protein